MPVEPYLGEIMYFAGKFAPRGWALCNGQPVPIQANAALFSLIGTTFGGNGVTTFNLPDLRGRVPIGTTLPGAVPVGQASGSEGHQLTLLETPSHTHTLFANASQAPSGNSETPTTGAVLGRTLAVMSDGSEPSVDIYHSTPAAPVPVAAQMISSTGSGQAHENRQPYAVLTACIALQGVFPSQP